jgi:hypothetical protein
MDYQSVENEVLNFPVASFESFAKKARNCVEQFSEENAIFELIGSGNCSLDHLHALLNTLFHQVYNGSSSFALAGAMCDSRYFKIREYLFHHAEEEQHHWKWIVQNLRDTGFTGSDPREVFPPFPTQAYVSFAMYLAHKQPVCRLAMAYILEGISGAYGVEYGSKMAKQMNLSRQQMSFFLLHGELDKGHSNDILEVLKDATLTPYEWAWCEYAAECTIVLYKSLYNYAAKQVGSLIVT